MATANELLASAAAIVASAATWVKYDNATNGSGRFVPIGNQNAEKFDVYGALLKAHWESGNTSWVEFHEAYDVARSRIPADFRNRDIEDWNDWGTFENAIHVLTGGGNIPTPPPKPKPKPDPEIIVTVLGTENNEVVVFDGNVVIQI